ncbi:MAG: hypothetical protein IJI84_06100 [Clostridia bacterium]|nr:hypothetical protein [Clostridia bacterium]
MISNEVDSKTKAKRKYNEKTYKRVSIYVKNEEMTVIEKFCKDKNYSKNNLFIQSIKEKIEKETGKKFQDLLVQMQTNKKSETAKSAEASGAENGEE